MIDRVRLAVDRSAKNGKMSTTVNLHEFRDGRKEAAELAAQRLTELGYEAKVRWENVFSGGWAPRVDLYMYVSWEDGK